MSISRTCNTCQKENSSTNFRCIECGCLLSPMTGIISQSYPASGPSVAYAGLNRLAGQQVAQQASLWEQALAYLNRAWSANGRVGRLEMFVIQTLLTTVAYLVILGVACVGALMMSVMGVVGAVVALLALLLAVLVMGYAQICVSIQRLHDLGQSGWWILLSFVPLVNFFLALALLFVKGNSGSNPYGYDPLEQPVEQTMVLTCAGLWCLILLLQMGLAFVPQMFVPQLPV